MFRRLIKDKKGQARINPKKQSWARTYTPTFSAAADKIRTASLKNTIKKAASADVGKPLKESGKWLGGKLVDGLIKFPIRLGRGEGILPSLMYILKPFLGLFFWIVGISLLIGIGIFGYSSLLYAQTGVGEAGYQRLAIGAQEWGLTAAGKLGLEKTYYAMFKPEKLLGPSFESQIETTQETKDMGVRFTKLEQTGRVFEEEPITIVGTIKAQSIEEDLDILVTCRLEDYEMSQMFDAQVSSTSGPGNPAKVFKGFPEILQATCTFPNGLIIPEGDQIFRTETAEMFATYDFKTLASMKLYLLDSNIKKNLALKQEDPFDYFGVKDSLLNSDRTMRSKATKGPINLGIGTYQSQPFSQHTPYWFGVAIKNNLDWHGNLHTIQKLDIMVPPNVVLESDQEFQLGEGYANIETCSFEPTGHTNQDGSKIYTLKDEVLEYINRDCELTKGTQISEQECIDLFKTDLEFRCRFMVTDIPYRELKHDFIEAEAKYKYKTEKQKAVTVRKLPDQAFEESRVEIPLTS